MISIRNYLQAIQERAVQQYENKIIELVEANPKVIFLDCGCDTGDFTIKVADAIGTKFRYGIDIVKERYVKAQEKGIIVREGDLNNRFPFEDEFADIILANQVIEHIFNLDNFSSEIYRVLKPRGYAIISTENLASWHNILSLFLGYQPFSLTNIVYGKSIGNPLGLHYSDHKCKGLSAHKSFMHTRVLSFQGLKDLFEIYNFQIEEIAGSGYFPLPPFFANVFSYLDKRHTAFLLVKVRKV